MNSALGMTNDGSALTEGKKAVEKTVMSVLWVLSLSHLINDSIQSLLPAIYPLLKASYHLDFTQIGMITLTYQITASLLQPFVGSYTDRRPKPYSLAVGMGFTLVGLVLLSHAGNFHLILVSAALVGVGSSVFHPEASRVAHLAAGERHGFAQAFFQVGGNLGTSFGPLLAALIIVPWGQPAILWFSILALLGIFLLTKVGGWYRLHTAPGSVKTRAKIPLAGPVMPFRKVFWTMTILIVLVFSKYFYLVSLTNYYTFYLISKFHVTVQASQIYLFVFLFSVAAGTILGGPLGDRFGRKYVIWFSILGVAPFTLILPHVGLLWTALLTVLIGVVLASAFSAILVYAQELIPGKVGMVAGMFFGFAFGISGIASAALGSLADHTSINYVFQLCGFLPLIGLLAAFLPDLGRRTRWGK